jgi:hypothetical protein
MTSMVINLSHTIVSFRCNSGETRHLPPDDSITVLTVEIAENEKIHKLEELGLITIHQDTSPAHGEPASTPEKSKRVRAQQDKQ